MPRATPWIVAIVWLLAATSALAQSPRPDTDGRAHFDRGIALFTAQDFNGALAEFQAAYDVSHRPTVLYNIGVTQQALHHYPEAARAIEQFLREATITPERRAQVEQGVEGIRQYIAHVTIGGLPSGATLTIDGDVVGTAPFGAAVAVGTGRHVLVAHATGFRESQQTLLIAGGQQRNVQFVLEPEATASGNGATTVASGDLDVRGAPAGAVIEIDGARATTPTTLAPGAHRISVGADGYRTWAGSVRVASGAHVVARANLARTGRVGPAPVVIAAALTAIAGVAAIAMGIATVQTHDTFLTLDGAAPLVMSTESSGNTERDTTNVLIGVAIAGALVTVGLITRTTFGPRDSRVDVAAAPNGSGGGAVAVRVRF